MVAFRNQFKREESTQRKIASLFNKFEEETGEYVDYNDVDGKIRDQIIDDISSKQTLNIVSPQSTTKKDALIGLPQRNINGVPMASTLRADQWKVLNADLFDMRFQQKIGLNVADMSKMSANIKLDASVLQAEGTD